MMRIKNIIEATIRSVNTISGEQAHGFEIICPASMACVLRLQYIVFFLSFFLSSLDIMML